MEEGVDDRELIARAGAGDRLAFEALAERHADRVYRFVRRLVASEAAAEDALQETFVAAWRGAAAYRGEGSVRGWLLGLARRQAARTWRRRAGEPLVAESIDAPLVELGLEAGWGADPEAVAAAAEDRDRVRAALARLSDEDRAILVLRDLEQLSGPETAQSLDLSLAAMKSRLHRARLRLMAELRADGGAP